MKKALMVCGNYWTSPMQVGSHHIAKNLVDLGWQVGFISDPISPLHVLNGISKELKDRFFIYKNNGLYDKEKSLWTYIPGALFTPHNKPVLRSKLISRIWYNLTFPNIYKMIKKHGFDNVDLLYFDSPNQSYLLNYINYKKAVYRIADNNMLFSKNSTDSFALKESCLISSVDLALYTAKNLKSYIERYNPKKTVYFPNGVDFNHFYMAGQEAEPKEYKDIPKPIALYVGAISDWFDFDLINLAAKKLKDISFVLIGPEEMAVKKLEKLPNIYILGVRNFKDIPKYMNHADVGLMPFDVNNFSGLVNSINPLKLYEYIAVGLPVVSVKWDALEDLNSPAILADSKENFISAIDKAVKTFKKPVGYEKYAERLDWKICTQKLVGLLE